MSRVRLSDRVSAKLSKPDQTVRKCLMTQSSTGWSSSGCRRSKGADGAPTRSVANESAADRGRDSVGVLVPEAGSTRRGARGVGASRRN